jgi:hypothetical protein
MWGCAGRIKPLDEAFCAPECVALDGDMSSGQDAAWSATPVLPAFFSSKKLRSIEKTVRTVEYRDERRSVGSMRDMDVAARSPHEVTCANAAFRIFQRSFEHEGLFERGVLVQWHDRAGRHPEQDGRASFVVLVQDLHLDSVEIRSLPGHRRRGDEGGPKFGRVDGRRLVVDGQRLVHGFFSGTGRDRAAFRALTTQHAEIERRHVTNPGR